MASERKGVPDRSSHRGLSWKAWANAHAPGQILPEVVGLVGDDQRPARERTGPARGRLGHARVGDRDAVKAGRGLGRIGVGGEIDAQVMSGPRPLPGEGRGGAGDRDRRDRTGVQLRPGELQRRARLARTRGRRDQEGTVLPGRHPGECAGLPEAERGAIGLGARGGHGSRIVKDAPDEMGGSAARREPSPSSGNRPLPATLRFGMSSGTRANICSDDRLRPDPPLCPHHRPG